MGSGCPHVLRRGGAAQFFVGGKEMQIIIKGIGEIQPYENTQRNNDSAVDAVAASIREFGWQQPIQAGGQ
jgi:hypothetical protein